MESSPINRPHTPDRLTFVGRERELAFLTESLAATSRSTSRIVLVCGEPGVGKTRLLSEFGNRARTGACLVLTGRAYDTEGMPPYLPFIEALQEYVHTIPLDDLRSQLGDAAPEVALLLPEVGRRFPDIAASTPLVPQSERYRLWESVTAFLTAIARSTPGGLLLCLEDLHWADEASLLLLDHVSRGLEGGSFLIIATYRDTETNVASPLARVLEQMARRDGSQRLELKRLTRDEVGAMLDALGRLDSPPAAVVDAFYGETDGNPFFVRELFVYLAEADRLFVDGAWRPVLDIRDTDVPHNARLVIGRRLESVGVDCRHMLGLAAVAGRTFNYELLLAVAELDEGSLLDAIDQAVAANLLASEPQSIAFAHELIRQTLLSSLSLPRKQAFHLRIAAAIEKLYASDLDSYLADLAGHYSSAGTSEAMEKTIDYSTRAGDRAATLLAFEEALRLYDVALAIIQSRGTDQDATLAAVLVKRAEVLVALARWQEARAAFQAAASYATDEARANVFLSLAHAALRPQIDVPLARSAAQEAVLLSRNLGRPDLESDGIALVAECDLNDGKIRSALAQYEKAYSQGLELHLAERRELRSYHRGLYWAGRIDEAVERGREAVRGARRVQDAQLDVTTTGDLGLALASSGRFVDAEEAFTYAKARALAYGAPGIMPGLARTIGMSCVIPMELFDFLRAEALAEEARDISRSANFMLTYVSEGIDLMCVYTHRGEFDRADAMAIEIGQLLHHGVGSHGPIWNARLAQAQAEVALERGNLQEAVLISGSAVELARAIGRPKYEALSLSVRGKALVRMGKKRDGLEDLRQAVEVVRPMGAPAIFLRTAAALLACDGDDTLAAEARERADKILANLSEDMKARFEASQPVQLVYRLMDPKTAGDSPRVIHPDGLTEREVEVLQLIASGKSSREIGDVLVLSVRTVERHIANIYLKTDTHGRAQVTAYALHRGLS